MRRLGQHFLKDMGPVRRIVAALEARPGETTVEIGPGHGELTAAVLEKVKTGHGRLLIIERDPKLAAALRERFKGEDSLRVTEGNALELLPDAVAGIKGEYSVAGNIPYYITGHLLRVLGSLPRKPRRTALMIQEEVAERLTAQPPRMNRLAASVQFWAEPKILTRVPRSAFDPPPKVDSAVVILETKDKREAGDEEFEKLLGAVFRQPRKTIQNNLKDILPGPELLKIFKDLDIQPGARPQNLSLEDLTGLARKIGSVAHS